MKIHTLGHHSTYLHIEKQILIFIKNIYLVFSSLETQERLIQTKVYYKLFSLKKQLTNLQERHFQKAFSPLCPMCYGVMKKYKIVKCKIQNTVNLAINRK